MRNIRFFHSNGSFWHGLRRSMFWIFCCVHITADNLVMLYWTWLHILRCALRHIELSLAQALLQLLSTGSPSYNKKNPIFPGCYGRPTETGDNFLFLFFLFFFCGGWGGWGGAGTVIPKMQNKFDTILKNSLGKRFSWLLFLVLCS